MPSQTLPELADATRRVLRDHGGGTRALTLHEASKISGVSATMIQAMSKGRAVGCEGVIRFAHAFGEDVPTWLKLAGYTDIAHLWGHAAPSLPTALSSSEIRRARQAAETLHKLLQSVPA